MNIPFFSLEDPVPEKSNPADYYISSLAIKVGEEKQSHEHVVVKN